MANSNLEDAVFWLDFPASFLGLARSRCIRDEPRFNSIHFVFCVLILISQILLRIFLGLELFAELFIHDHEVINKTVILVELFISGSELFLNSAAALFVIFKTQKFTCHLSLIEREAKRLGCAHKVKIYLRATTIKCSLLLYGCFSLYFVERCFVSFGQWKFFLNGIFLAFHMLTFALYKFKLALVAKSLKCLFQRINDCVMTVEGVQELELLRKSHQRLCGVLSKINLLFQNVMLASEASEFVLIVYKMYIIMMLVLDIEKTLHGYKLFVISRAILFVACFSINYLYFSSSCDQVLGEVLNKLVNISIK